MYDLGISLLVRVWLSYLTSPVRWTQSVMNMLADGMTEFVECGPGTVLTKLIERVQRTVESKESV